MVFFVFLLFGPLFSPTGGPFKVLDHLVGFSDFSVCRFSRSPSYNTTGGRADNTFAYSFLHAPIAPHHVCLFSILNFFALKSSSIPPRPSRPHRIFCFFECEWVPGLSFSCFVGLHFHIQIWSPPRFQFLESSPETSASRPTVLLPLRFPPPKTPKTTTSPTLYCFNFPTNRQSPKRMAPTCTPHTFFRKAPFTSQPLQFFLVPPPPGLDTHFLLPDVPTVLQPSIFSFFSWPYPTTESQIPNFSLFFSSSLSLPPHRPPQWRPSFCFIF